MSSTDVALPVYDDVDSPSTGYDDHWSTRTSAVVTSTTRRVAVAHRPSDSDYAFVWIYVSPLVLLVGMVGNALTLCVMTRRRLSGTSTCVYLSAMAVADTLALLCRIPPEFFEACDLFVFSELNRWTCKLEKFSFYTTSDAAIWILVVFTLDRLIAVSSPLLKHTVCAPRRAAVVCCCVIALSVCKNLHVFWTRDVEYNPQTGQVKRVCGRPEPYRAFENDVRPWLALTLVTAVPFVVIVLSNTIIVRKLIEAHQVRHQTLTSPRVLSINSSVTVAATAAINGSCNRASTAENLNNVTTSQTAMKSAIFSQTSLMCLAVSLAFLICVTPSIVLTIGRERWNTRASYYAARAVSHLLSCVNHAINFFLYCITGQRFRDELIGLVRRRRSSTSSGFDEYTRRYYMTRRLTQTSTGLLVMRSLPASSVAISSPITEDSENEQEF